MVSRKTESAEMVDGSVSSLHGSASWASPTELGMVATARGFEPPGAPPGPCHPASTRLGFPDQRAVTAFSKQVV